MTFFDQIYEGLFPKGKKEHKILTFEILKRSDAYRHDYLDWVQSDAPQIFLKRVSDSYYLKLENKIGDPDVHIFNSSQSNGFAISFNERLDRQQFQFFFDWIAERVEIMGYKRSNSDLTITDKGDFVEAVEKHYLKPKQKSSGVVSEQGYGNILIELISVNDVPSYLKFVANTYSDRSYKKPVNFDVLAEYLFEFG
ncbi:MAG: hypothetical protein JXR10_04660 [Cyclobacteriaceae bacterium]